MLHSHHQVQAENGETGCCVMYVITRAAAGTLYSHPIGYCCSATRTYVERATAAEERSKVLQQQVKEMRSVQGGVDGATTDSILVA